MNSDIQENYTPFEIKFHFFYFPGSLSYFWKLNIFFLPQLFCCFSFIFVQSLLRKESNSNSLRINILLHFSSYTKCLLLLGLPRILTSPRLSNLEGGLAAVFTTLCTSSPGVSESLDGWMAGFICINHSEYHIRVLYTTQSTQSVKRKQTI